MSQTKHTPGPWYLIDDVQLPIQENESSAKYIGTFNIKTKPLEAHDVGLWLAAVHPYECSGFTSKEEANANAKLIAAAPDMFTELKDNHEFLLQLYNAINNRNGLDFNSIQQDMRDRMAKQLDIINKATA